MTAAVVTTLGITLAAYGPVILTLWTGGQVAYDTTVYWIQLAAALVYSLWQASSVVSVAVNTFGILAVSYLASAALALLAGWALVRGFGAVGLASSAFVVDAIMIWVAVPRSLRITGDSAKLIIRDIAARLHITHAATKIKDDTSHPRAS
jgi:O-antigen/teichoic acid export membrane protein